MSDLAFPFAGTLFVFAVTVPLWTLGARAALAATTRGPAPHGRAGSSLVHALLLSPVLGPVLWLVSAAAHQTEADAATAPCAVDHLAPDLCSDVAWFGACLLGVLAVALARRGMLSRHDDAEARPPLPPDDPATRRVRRIAAEHGVEVPVQVVSSAAVAMATRGLLRPRIEIDAGLLARLDDAELGAALLHEREHARSHDPLRILLAQATLALNPARSLLGGHYARWSLAREIDCDRGAVAAGADPLALARSIVVAAAPVAPRGAFAALGGTGLAGVRLRVFLLTDPTGPKTARGASTHAGLAVATAVATLLLLPHLLGTAPLDALHTHAEAMLAALLGAR